MSQGPNVDGQDGYVADPVNAGGANPHLRQALWATTGAFGLTAWVVSLAAVVPMGFAVPLAVLASAVAVIGLLPGQAVRGWLTVAVAFTAFTAAVSTTVAVGGAGWVLTIDVLVALQVVVAVSALLLELRGSAVPPSAPENDYAAYMQYLQDYRDYAQQYGYGSYWPDQYSAAGAADAAGYAQGTVAGTAISDQDAWADMQAKYAQHSSPMAPAPPERSGRQADGEDAADPSVPRIDRADRAYEAQDLTGPVRPHAPLDAG
jgi:hypothetical protein